jgi:hypothetical protein
MKTTDCIVCFAGNTADQDADSLTYREHAEVATFVVLASLAQGKTPQALLDSLCEFHLARFRGAFSRATEDGQPSSCS